MPEKPKSFRLKPGMKVVFYVSKSGMRLAGEGESTSIEFLSRQDAVRRFGKRLIISEGELDEYEKRRPGRAAKLMLVITLGKILSYPRGRTYYKNITMAGEYLTPRVYEKIASGHQ